MPEAITSVLAFAVGVGVSPIPIVAVILMLFTERAGVNGPVYLLGWVIGLAAVVTVAYVVARVLSVGSSDTAATGVSYLKIGLGVLMLSAAARHWRKRPKGDEEPTMPTWMARVDAFTPPKAFGLAIALAAVNPKNLVLTIGAATSLAGASPTTGQALVAIVVFVVIGSALVTAAVLYQLLGGATARQRLDTAKAWLTRNNSVVMAAVFAAFGIFLVVQGLNR